MVAELFDRSGDLVLTKEIPDARAFPDIIVWKSEGHRRFFSNQRGPTSNRFVESSMLLIEDTNKSK